MELVHTGHIAKFIQAGARLHQAGCNGCIGMGQAPATGKNSLRTTPRNFPGRSGTMEDSVYLCSPETAAASALTGEITDPRTLQMDVPKIKTPEGFSDMEAALEAPPKRELSIKVKLEKGPNIVSIPEMEKIDRHIELPVLLKMGDNISTDEILAGGSRVLPYRSNLPEISKFTFEIVDPTYYERSRSTKDSGGHAVIGGFNYGQGSSREHAALAPRYLGLKVVLVKDFARIHRQNLINFRILPITFVNEVDYKKIEQGDILRLNNIYENLEKEKTFLIEIKNKEKTIEVAHHLTPRQIKIILAEGLI